MSTHSNRLIRPGLAALLGLAALGAAHADSGRMMPRDVPKAYIAECAACHTAYAPGLLPARSWQRIMGGLDKHYDTDASLDEATVKQLSTWLQANAGTYKRVNEEPPQDRLTRSAWFERKHDDIPPSVWKHTAIKSAANCGACHTGADRGDFDDDHIRLPAGVSLGLRRFWHD
jgi:mono/diheme cytochrome c family protein